MVRESEVEMQIVDPLAPLLFLINRCSGYDGGAAGAAACLWYWS